MDHQYVIVGGGGHALSMMDALLSTGIPVSGYIAPVDRGELAPGVSWLGEDTALELMAFERLRLINGLGSIGTGKRLRRDVYLQLRRQGLHFSALVHAAATVSDLAVVLGDAHQVLAGAVVNAGVECGDNVLINTRAVVEHGCRIGDHCHVATGAVLCGEVRLGDDVHIGAGATILQGLEIGSGSVIAAGSVVTKNVKPLTLVAGVPGQVKRMIEA